MVMAECHLTAGGDRGGLFLWVLPIRQHYEAVAAPQIMLLHEANAFTFSLSMDSVPKAHGKPASSRVLLIALGARRCRVPL